MQTSGDSARFPIREKTQTSQIPNGQYPIRYSQQKCLRLMEQKSLQRKVDTWRHSHYIEYLCQLWLTYLFWYSASRCYRHDLRSKNIKVITHLIVFLIFIVILIACKIKLIHYCIFNKCLSLYFVLIYSLPHHPPGTEDIS